MSASLVLILVIEASTGIAFWAPIIVVPAVGVPLDIISAETSDSGNTTAPGVGQRPVCTWAGWPVPLIAMGVLCALTPPLRPTARPAASINARANDPRNAK